METGTGPALYGSKQAHVTVKQRMELILETCTGYAIYRFKDFYSVFASFRLTVHVLLRAHGEQSCRCLIAASFPLSFFYSRHSALRPSTQGAVP